MHFISSEDFLKTQQHSFLNKYRLASQLNRVLSKGCAWRRIVTLEIFQSVHSTSSDALLMFSVTLLQINMCPSQMFVSLFFLHITPIYYYF